MGSGKRVDAPAHVSGSPSPSTTSKKLLPWLVAVAFLLEQLDTTILNTAVPAVAHALGVSVLSMKAVLASVVRQKFLNSVLGSFLMPRRTAYPDLSILF
jgi:hypothetical protein